MNSYFSDIAHLENSSEFLCGLIDIDFRFLHANRLFQKQFGLDGDSWKGRFFPEVVQSFETEKLIEANAECIRNPGKTICIEIQTSTATNESWFRWEISAIVDQQYKVKGVRFVGTDITRQKKAEQTLLQQAILLDSISDAIISTDENFQIKSWNLTAETMFRLKRSGDGVTTLHDVKNVFYINDTEKDCKSQLANQGFWNGQILVEKKDGTKLYIQSTVNKVKDKSGYVSGFVAVSRDITQEHEIKKLFDLQQRRSKLQLVKEQQALKKSNELFEYAAKATRDVIWDWDVKENKIRRTGGYKNLFGHKISNAYEEHNYQKIHPEDLDNVTAVTEKALKGNDSRWQMEYKYLCNDGSYKIVIDQAYIIRDKNGNAVRVIGSMQDVTEERFLQRQVLITEIQKKKDVVTAVINAQEKERNELSAELHDNVNQLLAASILYLKTARKQEVIEENLVAQSLDHVEKAVNELRIISHNLIPGELKMNGLSAALKALTGKLHIPKTFEVKLMVEKLDDGKLHPSLQLAVYRIIQEAINNILKHAGATKVSITIGDKDNVLKLTVKDNGKGFIPSEIKKGLGITNIHTRSENLGGNAELISAPGKGCMWQICIPLTVTEG